MFCAILFSLNDYFVIFNRLKKCSRELNKSEKQPKSVSTEIYRKLTLNFFRVSFYYYMSTIIRYTKQHINLYKLSENYYFDIRLFIFCYFTVIFLKMLLSNNLILKL